MKINTTEFKKGFPEQKASQGIDPEKVNEHMKNFYGEDAVYSKENIGQVKTQVQKMCNYMNDLGLENFIPIAIINAVYLSNLYT